MSIVEDLSNLLLPARCEICGRLPKPICDACWLAMDFRVRPVTRGDLQGISIAEYSGAIADLLNAVKERSQRAIGERLADQIIKLVPRPDVQILVAAPSSVGNFASRGFTPAEVLARRLARSWALPVTTLRFAKQRTDQAKLSRALRLSNLVGAMTAVRPLNQMRVLLIDDIVTTGATLTEMRRSVISAGGEVDGFITLAETIPKTRTKNLKRV